jgi:single-stranded-DNA-specific exonuclease
LQDAVGGHSLVATTLARLGINTPEAARAFLDPDRYHPSPPTELPNLARAAERLERAIHDRERICVWGDFDVDGQTSTTILFSTLQDLGADVLYHIPIRAIESHGVHLPTLKRTIARGTDLVLTCDTGVSAHKAIIYARTQDVDVIVTDHHDLPPTLPEAYAVVNPKQLSDDHPLRELSGAGCAYKLAEALYERAGHADTSMRHLDLVTLGLVADVATMTGDTRYLVQRGLEALRHTKRLGLQVLMEIAEVRSERITEEHIGYQIAPRLNALGRLSDANPIVELLTTDDVARARTLAAELEGLNAQRKLLCDQVFQAAQAQIARDPSLLKLAALVLSHPSWPGGVIGIVAGRLASQYHRPTILISTPPDEIGRGSARSIAGCNISAAIAAQKELLIGFGGHPMAAGLGIKPEHIPAFRRALSRTIQDMCGQTIDQATLQIDAYVALSDLSLELAEEIERLAPFGAGNPPLVLAARSLSLLQESTLGRHGEHRLATVQDDEGNTQEVLWWRGAGERLPQGRFDLAYAIRTSDYRGKQKLQLEWIDARQIQEPPGHLHAPQAQAIQIVDHRKEPFPTNLLKQLREQDPHVLVWAEANARAQVAGCDRNALIPTHALAIWTTPPGPTELRAGLDRAEPKVVYIFGQAPDLDEPDKFLRRLTGLIKQALQSEKQGQVSIANLAAATAQREATVRTGIDWLAARGHVLITQAVDDKMHLALGQGGTDTNLPQITHRLKTLLEETAAYRAYFDRTDKEILI